MLGPVLYFVNVNMGLFSYLIMLFPHSGSDGNGSIPSIFVQFSQFVPISDLYVLDTRHNFREYCPSFTYSQCASLFPSHDFTVTHSSVVTKDSLSFASFFTSSNLNDTFFATNQFYITGQIYSLLLSSRC